MKVEMLLQENERISSLQQTRGSGPSFGKRKTTQCLVALNHLPGVSLLYMKTTGRLHIRLWVQQCYKKP